MGTAKLNSLGLDGLARSYVESLKTLRDLEKEAREASGRATEQATRLAAIEASLTGQAREYNRTLNIQAGKGGAIVRVDLRAGYEKAFISVEPLDRAGH